MQRNIFALILFGSGLCHAQTISTVAGDGSSSFSGDGGPATSATLMNPYGVAVDNNGNFYFTDSGNARIRKVNSSGIISTPAGGTTPISGQEIAVTTCLHRSSLMSSAALG